LIIKAIWTLGNTLFLAGGMSTNDIRKSPFGRAGEMGTAIPVGNEHRCNAYTREFGTIY
jgi:hypothetical protein